MTLATIDHPEVITRAEAESRANSIIDQYTGWAIALMRTVEAKKLYAVIKTARGPKKYLEFEAWQLIGGFDRCYVDTEEVSPIEANGVIIGHVCHAKLYRDGVRVGAATQMCGFDSFPCRGKEGSAKDNAAISAAQTWAASKAFRMRYSVVAVLGGYEPTTADEMRRAQEETPDQTPSPAKSRTPAGTCPRCQIKMGRDSQGRACHKLPDGSFCYGVAATSEDAGATSSEESKLIADYTAAGLTAVSFDSQVLHMKWTEWEKLNGANAVAKAQEYLATWIANRQPAPAQAG